MKNISTILFVFLAVFQLQAKKQSQPNVIMIYTDDHRYSGVHALAGEAVHTPNLDDLAHSGVVFTHTYLMGAFSGATCIPSRAMLHTGRNLFEIDGVGHNIPKTHTTMGEAFQNAGYYTYHVGKWHQDMPALARSFDDGASVSGKPIYLTDQFRMPYSDWDPTGKYDPKNCYLLEYNEAGEVVRRTVTKDEVKGPVGTEKNGPHVSEVLADNAIEFVKNYDEKDPFFMYLAFPCPHDPRQAPQEYRDMYPVENIQLPPSYMTQHPFDNGHIVLRDEELAPWPRTPEVAKQHLADYYAIITHLDAQIGRVIKALKAAGKYENTIIVMSGDSGLGVGNHGLIGKQNVYDEDGVHVPLIFSGGLVKLEDQGRRVSAFAYIHDIYPTICDLANIEKPASVTGKSLAPIINNKVETVREHTYHAYMQYQRAYRKGDYKLIEYVRAPGYDWQRGDIVTGSRVTQLFDMSKDPWETLNLADFPQYEEKVAELRKEMKEKAVELNDVADGKRTKFDFWDNY